MNGRESRLLSRSLLKSPVKQDSRSRQCRHESPGVAILSNTAPYSSQRGLSALSMSNPEYSVYSIRKISVSRRDARWYLLMCYHPDFKKKRVHDMYFVPSSIRKSTRYLTSISQIVRQSIPATSLSRRKQVTVCRDKVPH